MSSRRIDDMGGWPHTSDMAMKSKNKLEHEESAEGAGAMHDYPDTTEDIHRDQKHGVSKLEGRKMKTGYRN